MKRTLLIFLIVFIVMQFIRTEQINIASVKNDEIVVPLEVSKIFEKSCNDCHTNKADWPWYSEVAPFSWIISSHVKNGRKALNFSDWGNYTEAEKEVKMKRIYRTVYAAMPLQSYIWLHEEADLTKEERALIRKWTGVRNR